jgi:hypothetical protein
MHTYTTFVGDSLLVTGDLRAVLRRTREWLDQADPRPMLIFDDETGKQVEFDLRGTPDEVIEREAPRPGPGRPKLGVTSREVSLLPRHWEWLQRQPSGASAALRRLVEVAMKADPGDRARARDAAYRVMTALAGDRPGYEEATRALFAGDYDGLRARTADWPPDVRAHLDRLLETN